MPQRLSTKYRASATGTTMRGLRLEPLERTLAAGSACCLCFTILAEIFGTGPALSEHPLN